jgi:hypothetical protein
MDRSEASALADLQMHWDEAYVIGLDGNIWSARYRRSADQLRAHTSSELRELIRSDYAYRQKADLVAYDGDDDDRAEDDRAEDDRAEDEEAASEDGTEDTGAGGDGAQGDGAEDYAADGYPADAVTGPVMDQDDDEAAAAAARANALASDFATIRGERMST